MTVTINEITTQKTLFWIPVHFGCFQPAIACSKLTTETLEQGVKYVQS